MCRGFDTQVHSKKVCHRRDAAFAEEDAVSRPHTPRRLSGALLPGMSRRGAAFAEEDALLRPRTHASRRHTSRFCNSPRSRRLSGALVQGMSRRSASQRKIRYAANGAAIATPLRASEGSISCFSLKRVSELLEQHMNEQRSCAAVDHAVAPVGSAVCRCVSPASLC
jgi:hypothetical protein